MQANLAALETLRVLEREDRAATSHEQQLLARWSGWGAVPKLFDPHASEFDQEREQARELLSETDYARARRSTLNAHYTDAALAGPMWRAVTALGATGGRVLEPGCGSGTFLGLAPARFAPTGVELEPTTAAIAAALYPHADVLNASFAEVTGGEGAFDAVVGNVPFGRARLHDPEHNRDRHPIHTHFVLKSLHMAAPGAPVALVTSRYLLDGLDATARREISELADLITAVRLPSGAHRRAAGTEVVTDVLLLRRRDPGTDPQHVGAWEQATTVTVPDRTGGEVEIGVNEFFIAHPGNVLGTLASDSGRFGQPDLVVADGPSQVGAALETALTSAAEHARQRGLAARETSLSWPVPLRLETARRDHGRFEGMITANGDGSFARWVSNRWGEHAVPKKQTAELRQLIGLRETVQALLGAEHTTSEDTDEIAELRSQLNTRYDDYRDRYGPVNRFSWKTRALPGWTVFGRWCGGQQRDKIPAQPDTILEYLRHLADAGVDRERAGKHLAAIADRHADKDVPLDPATMAQAEDLVDSCPEVADPLLDAVELGLVTEARATPPQGGFRTDPFSSLVRALEQFDPATQTAAKADVFTQRVVAPRQAQTRAASPADALSICLNTHAQVRLDVIADLLELADADAAREVLTGGQHPLAFADPESGQVQARNDYLSGNVRAKLRAAEAAAETNPAYDGHVAALSQVVPPLRGLEEIEIQLGSWIEAPYVEQFLITILEDPAVRVDHPGARLWVVTGGNQNATPARFTWGTEERSAQELTESVLAGRTIRITYTDRKGHTHTDATATEAAQAQAAAISERFTEWVWEDPQRADELVTIYNDRFNGHIPRVYDDVELTLPGLSDTISLRPHQKAAVAAQIFNPAFGLYHEVGAGKTLEMIVGAMERKRLGLTARQVFNVPNHMLEQFEREWLQAYPQSSLLTASREELSGTARRDFVARAATGDYDAVILTEGAFRALPVSPEVEERFIAAEREEIEQALTAARESATARTVKELEERLQVAEEATKGKLAKINHDGGLCWDDFGFDTVIVDESQRFKNSRRFSSLPSMGHPGSDRATDLDMKLADLVWRYGHSRYISATATPFTNSLAEIYTELARLGDPVDDLDSWARTWGTMTTSQEMVPGGTYKEVTRLRELINAPELALELRMHADIRTAEDLNLPTPEVAGGGPQIITIDAADELAEFNAELADRYKALEPRPGPGQDNHLSLINEAISSALDLRLVDRDTAEPQKVDVLVDRIHQRWLDHRDDVYLRPDGTEHPTRGSVQLVFCSLSTPKRDRWNVYDEIRNQLADRGMPRALVRFIHEAKNDQQKAELFAAARSGDIAVLIGSSEKMGTGTNAQTRAIGLYQVSPPWRADIPRQEIGRVVRQGNQNSEVFVDQLVTAPSLETKKWKIVRDKDNGFRPLMTGQIAGRNIEMPDEDTDHFAELMAAASGDARILEKAELESHVNRLQRLQQAWARQQSSFRLTVSRAETDVPPLREKVTHLDTAISQRRATSGDAFTMTVGTTRHTARPKAAAALAERIHTAVDGAPKDTSPQITVGELAGFTVSAEIRRWNLSHTLALRLDTVPGEITLHHSEVSASHYGLITRLEYWISGLENRRDALTRKITQLSEDAEQVREQIGVPFSRQAELDDTQQRLTTLTQQLAGADTDTSPDTPEQADPKPAPPPDSAAADAPTPGVIASAEPVGDVTGVAINADGSTRQIDVPGILAEPAPAPTGEPSVAPDTAAPADADTSTTPTPAPDNSGPAASALAPATDAEHGDQDDHRAGPAARVRAVLGQHAPELSDQDVTALYRHVAAELADPLLTAQARANDYDTYVDRIRERILDRFAGSVVHQAGFGESENLGLAVVGNDDVQGALVDAIARDSHPALTGPQLPAVAEFDGPLLAMMTRHRISLSSTDHQALRQHLAAELADPDLGALVRSQPPATIPAVISRRFSTLWAGSLVNPRFGESDTLARTVLDHREFSDDLIDQFSLHTAAVLDDGDQAPELDQISLDQLTERLHQAGWGREQQKGYFPHGPGGPSGVKGVWTRQEHLLTAAALDGHGPRVHLDGAPVTNTDALLEAVSGPSDSESEPEPARENAPGPAPTADAAEAPETEATPLAEPASRRNPESSTVAPEPEPHPGESEPELPSVEALTGQILAAEQAVVITDTRLPHRDARTVLVRISRAELDPRVTLAVDAATQALNADSARSPLEVGRALAQQQRGDAPVSDSDFEYRLRAIEALAATLDAEGVGDEPTARGRPRGHAPGETIAASLRTATAAARENPEPPTAQSATAQQPDDVTQAAPDDEPAREHDPATHTMGKSPRTVLSTHDLRDPARLREHAERVDRLVTTTIGFPPRFVDAAGQTLPRGADLSGFVADATGPRPTGGAPLWWSGLRLEIQRGPAGRYTALVRADEGDQSVVVRLESHWFNVVDDSRWPNGRTQQLEQGLTDWVGELFDEKDWARAEADQMHARTGQKEPTGDPAPGETATSGDEPSSPQDETSASALPTPTTPRSGTRTPQTPENREPAAERLGEANQEELFSLTDTSPPDPDQDEADASSTERSAGESGELAPATEQESRAGQTEASESAAARRDWLAALAETQQLTLTTHPQDGPEALVLHERDAPGAVVLTGSAETTTWVSGPAQLDDAELDTWLAAYRSRLPLPAVTAALEIDETMLPRLTTVAAHALTPTPTRDQVRVNLGVTLGQVRNHERTSIIQRWLAATETAAGLPAPTLADTGHDQAPSRAQTTPVPEPVSAAPEQEGEPVVEEPPQLEPEPEPDPTPAPVATSVETTVPVDKPASRPVEAETGTSLTRPADPVQRYTQINQQAAEYFSGQLSQSENHAQQYLHERLGNRQAVEMVRERLTVGYAPAGWAHLVTHLRELGHADEDLLAAGVATRNRRGGLIDRFRDRVVFGLHDEHDRLTGFTGRNLATSGPKYLNTGSTSLFDKSSALLSPHQREGDVVLVEGPLDVAAITAARAASDTPLRAVATCGTAVTDAHLDRLAALTHPGQRLIHALDGDQAGTTAGLEIAERSLHRVSEPVRITSLPDGHDPATWALAEGTASLRAYQDGAECRPALETLVQNRIGAYVERLDEVNAQVSAAHDVARLLARIPADSPHTPDALDQAARAATELLYDPSTMPGMIASYRTPDATLGEAALAAPPSTSTPPAAQPDPAVVTSEPVSTVPDQPVSSSPAEPVAETAPSPRRVHHSSTYGTLLLDTHPSDPIADLCHHARARSLQVGAWSWDDTAPTPEGTTGAWHIPGTTGHLAPPHAVAMLRTLTDQLAHAGLPAELDLSVEAVTTEAAPLLHTHNPTGPETGPSARPLSRAEHAAWAVLPDETTRLPSPEGTRIDLVRLSGRWALRASSTLQGHELTLTASFTDHERGDDIARSLAEDPASLPDLARRAVTHGQATATLDDTPLQPHLTPGQLRQQLATPATSRTRPPMPVAAALTAPPASSSRSTGGTGQAGSARTGPPPQPQPDRNRAPQR